MPDRSPSRIFGRSFLCLCVAALIGVALLATHGPSTPPPLPEAHEAHVLCVAHAGVDLTAPLSRVPSARATPAPELERLGLRSFSVSSGDASRLRDLLAAEPGVEGSWTESDASVAATIPNDPEFDAQWAAERMHLPEAWDITTGSPSVLIGLVDTGVQADHPDLAGNVLPGIDFVGGVDGRTDPNGHGTGLAGVLVGRGNDGQGFAGVAWNCRLLPARAAEEFGIASMSDVARGIVWCVDHGASVVVVGLGGEQESEAVDRALRYAKEHDVLVVAPAGNEPYDVEMYPARSPEVLCVAAGGQEDAIAWGVAFGRQTDILAPGEAVTAHPRQGTAALTGSSIAAAHVGGVAALLRSAAPSLTVAQVRAALVQEGDEIVDPAITEWTGVRSLNASRSLLRRDPSRTDLAVAGIRTLPTSPQPGQSTIVEVAVENRGNVDFHAVPLTVTGSGRILPGDDSRPDDGDDQDEDARGDRSVGDLKIGERRLLRFRWLPGGDPTSRVEARVEGVHGDAEPANDVRALDVPVERHIVSDVAFTRLAVADCRPSENRFHLVVTVENRGNRNEATCLWRSESTAQSCATGSAWNRFACPGP